MSCQFRLHLRNCLVAAALVTVPLVAAGCQSTSAPSKAVAVPSTAPKAPVQPVATQQAQALQQIESDPHIPPQAKPAAEAQVRARFAEVQSQTAGH